MSRKQPHIIIINPDEMRVDAMAHMGNPAALTPCLDAFCATEAVSFSNAFCQNPVCVPSRCSFFTGLYPHVRGHRTMEHLLHPGEDTLFSELKRAGYHVWMNSRNDLLAGQFDVLFEENADEIFPYRLQEHKPVDLSGVGPRPAMPDVPVTAPDMPQTPYSHYVAPGGPAQIGNDWNDTKGAIDRILSYDSEKPLCLFVGWNNPHVPYTVAEPYYSAIDRSKLPKRIPKEDLQNPPEIIRQLQQYVGMGEWTEEQWDELRATYLAQCMMVDDMFGQICDALKAAGMYDDSAIFFLSDHGDFTGDYDLVEKSQNSFQHCLTRVPFLIKPPQGYEIDPGVSDSLAELVDLYATVMNLAQVAPSHTQFGHSLVPVLADRSAAVRDYAFCEGGRLASETHCDEWHNQGPNGPDPSNAYWPKMTAQKDPSAHEKGTMIFDGRYKFVQRLNGDHEFYDLETDPGERNNRYPELMQATNDSNPENAGLTREILRLQQALLHWYQATCDTVPFTADSRWSTDQYWGILKRMAPPEMEEEIKTYIRTEHPSISAAFAHIRQMLKMSQK